MLYIKANHLKDGLYNIKDGEIFKYKAKGGTVRTYEIGNIVRCKECRWLDKGENESCSWSMCTRHFGQYINVNADDYCSYGVKKGADDE